MASDPDKTVVQRNLDIPAGQGESSYLVVLAGTAIGRMFKLEPGTHKVGRAGHMDIVLDDPGVSRVHAHIHVDGEGRVHIEDLASTNGTFVNDEKIDRAQLRDGDKIRIGSVTILKFAHQNALEAEFQRHLYDSVTRDALTGAYNKRYFDEDLQRATIHARRHREPLALALIDLDHFKAINDTHGHPTGDAVLAHAARVLAANTRRDDTLCRVGGEEFAVIMRACAESSAVVAADRLRSALESAPCELSDPPGSLRVTLSAGVAVFDPEAHPSPQALYEAADQALYQAKHLGRNRICRAGTSSDEGSRP